VPELQLQEQHQRQPPSDNELHKRRCLGPCGLSDPVVPARPESLASHASCVLRR